MSDEPANHWDVPSEWGRYCPREQLAVALRRELERLMPGSAWLACELLLYNQDRDDILVRCLDLPERIAVIHLSRSERRSRLDFDGVFTEFAARERRRHLIQRRMIEQPSHVPGVCPVCFAAVTSDGWRGIWTGSIQSRHANGPVFHGVCKSCRSEVIAMPTNEEAEAGNLVWAFYKWGPE